MRITNKIKLLSSLCAATLLAACSDSNTVNTETGTFMKGEVTGLIYTTETHTGVTDENGAYEYEPGESISFYIGGTKLGETISASAEIGPIDLVPGSSIPVTQGEVNEFFDTHWDDFGTDTLADARHEMLNIMMFLYTADKDKESSNGIFIDPTTHVTFAGNSYDLKIRASRFDNIDGIEDKLYEDFNAGGLGSARLIHRYKALDDFAKFHGLEPQLYVRTGRYTDEDVDGVVDDYYESFLDENLLPSGYASENSNEEVTYNQYGDWMGYQYDWDNDGTFDDWTLVTRDVHGNKLTEEWFGEGTGIHYYTYDDMGKLLSQETDSEIDGTINRIYTYSYDANGYRTSQTRDYDADGTPDRIYIYEYNADGRQVFYGRDNDGDGTLEYSYSYVYDANGRQIEYHYDSNADGSYDDSHFYIYDANDRQVSYQRDNNGDGVMNEIRTYTYDANGNQTLRAYDTNGDGTINYQYISTFDANSYIASEGYDGNGDGVLERISYWVHDAAGHNLEFSRDNNNDGTLDSSVFYIYDANGNNTEFRLDNNADGTLETHHQYTYDADGNQLQALLDFDADGTLDRIITKTYDANGNRSTQTEDEGADGTIDETISYQYQRISFLGWYLDDE